MHKIGMRLIRDGMRPTNRKKIAAAKINGLNNRAHTQLAVSQGNDDQLHDIRPSWITI